MSESILRAVFTKFDEDKSGQLSPDELAQGLYELGIDIDDAEFDAMMTAADADGSGEVDLGEFMAWAGSGGAVAAKLSAQLATADAADLQGDGPPAWTQRPMAAAAAAPALAAAAPRAAVAPVAKAAAGVEPRAYIAQTVYAVLMQAIKEVDKHRPADPALWLADYLTDSTKVEAPAADVDRTVPMITYVHNSVTPLLKSCLVLLWQQQPAHPLAFVAEQLRAASSSARS